MPPTDRPWSSAEVAEEIPALLGQLDDAVSAIRQLAIDAATARRDWKREEAKAWLVVKGANKEERTARVHLHQWKPTHTVGDLEYEAELAEGVLRSERSRIGVLQTRADLLRSLLVSSRAVA